MRSVLQTRLEPSNARTHTCDDIPLPTHPTQAAEKKRQAEAAAAAEAAEEAKRAAEQAKHAAEREEKRAKRQARIEAATARIADNAAAGASPAKRARNAAAALATGVVHHLNHPDQLKSAIDTAGAKTVTGASVATASECHTQANHACTVCTGGG